MSRPFVSGCGIGAVSWPAAPRPPRRAEILQTDLDALHVQTDSGIAREQISTWPESSSLGVKVMASRLRGVAPAPPDPAEVPWSARRARVRRSGPPTPRRGRFGSGRPIEPPERQHEAPLAGDIVDILRRRIASWRWAEITVRSSSSKAASFKSSIVSPVGCGEARRRAVAT